MRPSSESFKSWRTGSFRAWRPIEDMLLPFSFKFSKDLLNATNDLKDSWIVIIISVYGWKGLLNGSTFQEGLSLRKLILCSYRSICNSRGMFVMPAMFIKMKFMIYLARAGVVEISVKQLHEFLKTLYLRLQLFYSRASIII